MNIETFPRTDGLGCGEEGEWKMIAIKVTDGKVLLYQTVLSDTCERLTVSALLPSAVAKDWEGETLYLLNWKIDSEAGTVLLSYQTRNDAYAPIHDHSFPVEKAQIPLEKPNRSKNWKWSVFSVAWVNQKTGERVRVY